MGPDMIDDLLEPEIDALRVGEAQYPLDELEQGLVIAMISQR